MSTQTITSTTAPQERSTTYDQYTPGKILGIWALASIPGGLLFWLGLPILDRMTEIGVGYLVLIVTVIPYFWHFILVYLVLKKELTAGDADLHVKGR